MKNAPSLSVIMPCYNQSKYLGEAIEGVIGQTHKNLEVIIVDDFSTDNSVEIIEKYRKMDGRIRSIYHSSNLGVSKSRNDAISLAAGKYIAFCDADDIWERNKIGIQLETLERESGYDVVYSDSIIINEDGVPTGDRFSSKYNRRRHTGNIFGYLCLTNFINTPTVVLRRRCINSHLYFNETFKYLEDWIFWLRLASEYMFFYIDEPLARYRVHSRSTNRDEHGYKLHRIKCYKYIAEQYPKVSRYILSDIYYNIGVNYIAVGEKHAGRSYFIESIRESPLNYRSIIRLLGICFHR